MKPFITCIILLHSIYGNSQTVTTKIITVDPYLSFQNYEHFKRLTLSSPDSPTEYIDNFIFEWGYQYKLSVKEKRLREDLSDGTRYEYSLNHIITKTKVSDSFEFKLYIDPNRYYNLSGVDDENLNNTLKKLSNNTYIYFDKVEIEVPESLKEKFMKIIDGEKPKVGTFTFINEKQIKLIHL